MDQTPVHDICNQEVLDMIPPKARKLIEIGCSSGALAREYKNVNSSCTYIGLDIVADFAQLAKRFCDEVIVADIEKQDDAFYKNNKDCDCWIFADSLEHLVNPWLILKKVREIIPANGCIVACIPNAQNWRVVADLAIGNFRYQDSGLLDKSHLRWFTRQTIIELFDGAGFEIEAGNVRIFDDPNNTPFLSIIGEIAKFQGVNAEVAIQDSIPFQFVVRARPK